jgi:6-phosphogluconate dehydrogenase
MRIGMVGLGRMGGDIVRRLMAAGHECVVHDRSTDAVEALVKEGAEGAGSLRGLVAALPAPRAVWVMVPAGRTTTGVIGDLAGLLEAGDTVVDGGNTHYRDDVRHAATLREHGVGLVDCGTSGGVFGRERGYCLMIGGAAEHVERLDPVFRALAPGADAAGRTPGRTGEPAPEEQGYLHCGDTGAGHFVKMVHNGVEYGMMAALAEGLNILRHADAGDRAGADDAETAPMENSEFYRYTLDVPAIAEVWRRGSVISSWLTDLTAAALRGSPDLHDHKAEVADSGEGRWTSIAAVETGVPAPVLTAALYSRFASRGQDDFADRMLSAMRGQFGGHERGTGEHGVGESGIGPGGRTTDGSAAGGSTANGTAGSSAGNTTGNPGTR